MTPERWQKVSELYHAALERALEQRAQFLDQACDGDAELRQEVEGLLAAEDSAGSFMSGDAMEDAARILAEEQTGALIGQTISHYRVLELLGQGGMGEVYLAEDTHLKRKVALKLLPAYFVINRDRVNRFEQEARAVSTLNHPNIVTIHEVGRVNGSNFIVTEFVEGETLREMLSAGAFDISKALDLSIQIASALDAAHNAGIVHRDIKPENIMVRRDGYVKVLDFGLAKLIERQAGQPAEAPTKFFATTQPGLVMGSTSYMSPEQTRAMEVDERTDVWSLGVVLYEMLTGLVPFEGETQSDVIAAILERQPPSLAASAPGQLQWIVNKTLTKNRAERYQTMAEMLSDLRELKQELDARAHLVRGLGAAESFVPGDAAQANGTQRATHASSSAEYIVTEIKKHKTGAAFALAFLAVVLVGAGFGLYKLFSRKTGAPIPAPKFIALTTGGRAADQLIEGEATISPDGKYVTYVAFDEHHQQALWVKQVSTNNQVLLVPPSPTNYVGTTFSRDSEFVYYVRNELNSVIHTLYRIPVIGGTPVKVLDNVSMAVAFSPDGRRFAFVRSEAGREGLGQKLMLANTEGSGEPTVLASVKAPQLFPALTAPSWSPDGKLIAIAFVMGAGQRNCTLVGVSVADGKIAQLTAERWPEVGRVVWLPDSSGLVFTAKPERNSIGMQIWHLSYPEGKSRRITNDLNGYGDHNLGVTADGSTIATLQTIIKANVWVLASNESENRAKQVTSDGVDGFYDLSWLPDGRLVYDSRAGDNIDLWVMNADGTNRKQLTNDAYREFTATASPDGRYIVFQSERGDHLNLWRIDADGNNPKQLTTGDAFDFQPIFSTDGQWVVFTSRRGDKQTLWKVSIEGGAAQQLTDEMTYIPGVSPDGRLITYSRLVNQPGHPPRFELVFIPFDGGPAVKTMALPEFFTSPCCGGGQWAPDGGSLYFAAYRDNGINVWMLPLDGSPKQVTNFTSDWVRTFAISRDGRRLAVSRHRRVNDIVLIRDFR